MQLQSVLEWTRQRPFQPFKIILTDGEVIEVRHPEFVMPTYHSLVAGAKLDADGVPLHPRFISYMHIVKIESMTAAERTGTKTGA